MRRPQEHQRHDVQQFYALQTADKIQTQFKTSNTRHLSKSSVSKQLVMGVLLRISTVRAKIRPAPFETTEVFFVDNNTCTVSLTFMQGMLTVL